MKLVIADRAVILQPLQPVDAAKTLWRARSGREQAILAVERRDNGRTFGRLVFH
jgi:hypothetical protein